MKKNVLIIIATIFLCIPQLLYAFNYENKKSQIELISTRRYPKEDRTIIIKPSVSYEGHTLYFNTDVPLNVISLEVRDKEDRSVLYTGIFSLPAKQEIQITVPDLTEGCLIYVTINDETYKGVIENELMKDE